MRVLSVILVSCFLFGCEEKVQEDEPIVDVSCEWVFQMISNRAREAGCGQSEFSDYVSDRQILELCMDHDCAAGGSYWATEALSQPHDGAFCEAGADAISECEDVESPGSSMYECREVYAAIFYRALREGCEQEGLKEAMKDPYGIADEICNTGTCSWESNTAYHTIMSYFDGAEEFCRQSQYIVSDARECADEN